MKEYKLCFVGLGSIAERHIRNVKRVVNDIGCSVKIDVLRSGKGHSINGGIAKLIDSVYYSFDAISTDMYDAVFVTNPTFKHAETIKLFSGRTKAFFIEKPVFHTSEIDIDQLSLSTSVLYYVACPLRYHKVIEYIKKNVSVDKIINMRVISASYLPEWRPYSDYRKSYSAKKEWGGGVAIDLIHEWDYITYLIGYPKRVVSLQRKVSNLEIDSDDIAVYIGEYQGKIVELHLDYFTRKNMREIYITTNEFVLKADLIENQIEYLNTGERINFFQDRDDFQCREINYFFDIMENKKENTNDIERAIRTLKLAEGLYSEDTFYDLW